MSHQSLKSRIRLIQMLRNVVFVAPLLFSSTLVRAEVDIDSEKCQSILEVADAFLKHDGSIDFVGFTVDVQEIRLACEAWQATGFDQSRKKFSLSIVYLFEGNLNGSYENLSQYLILGPNSPYALYLRSVVAYRAGLDLNYALADVDKAIKLGVELNETLDRFYFLRGMLALEIYKETESTSDNSRLRRKLLVAAQRDFDDYQKILSMQNPSDLSVDISQTISYINNQIQLLD